MHAIRSVTGNIRIYIYIYTWVQKLHPKGAEITPRKGAEITPRKVKKFNPKERRIIDRKGNKTSGLDL